MTHQSHRIQLLGTGTPPWHIFPAASSGVYPDQPILFLDRPFLKDSEVQINLVVVVQAYEQKFNIKYKLCMLYSFNILKIDSI